MCVFDRFVCHLRIKSLTKANMFMTKLFYFDMEVRSVHKVVCSFEIVFIVVKKL